MHGAVDAMARRRVCTWSSATPIKKEPRRGERHGSSKSPHTGDKAMATLKRKGVDDAATQRLNIRVTSEAYERLLVHAIKARKSPGELVTELIDSGLREYRVQRNQSARVMSTESASGDDHVEESLQDAA
jgi:hypothetical protein